MSTDSKLGSQGTRWLRIIEQVGVELPHLGKWLSAEEEFIELRIKARLDGTTLAIAKSYAPDGSPMVCFGVGYGPYLALMAIDSSIQGGNWRPDKPWEPT